MHPLDIAEKTTKIIVGGVAALFFSYAGLTVNWERVGIQEDSFCVNFAETAEAAMLRGSEVIPRLVVQTYSDRCDVDLDEAQEFVATTAAVLQAVPVEQAGVTPVPIWLQPEPEAEPIFLPGPDGTPDQGTIVQPDGFVAIGTASDTANSIANFETVTGGALALTGETVPQPGDILAARWPVHLRENTQLTTSGRNPSLGLLSAGDCVTVLETPVIERGQYWAPVQRTDCS